MEEQWRDGNHFELLPGRERYIPALLSAIDEARESILFEQYLMESGRFADRVIDALIRASQRGVAVYMLLDNYGAKGLKKDDRARLRRDDIALRFFNPLSLGRLNTNLTRDHRKLVLIDRRVAFTGGFCVTDEFLEQWYDLALRIEGPVVDDWRALFARLWASSLTRGQRQANPPDGDSTSGVGSMRGRVIWGRGHRYQAIRLSLQQRIEQSQRRLWIDTPYFLPTPSLRRHLLRAALRGVDVRLLVAGPKHDHPSVRYAGQYYYARLLHAGVRIYEYQPSFTHAKFCLVDDWCTLGSCNFDHWSLQWNLEANQEVDDADFAERLATLFQDNLADSHEIRRRQWERRPWWQKSRERAFGTVNAALTLLR